MDDLVELKAICELLRCECVKFFEEGNKTAGTRARKMLQQVKGKAQDLRVGIQETKRQMDLVKNSDPGAIGDINNISMSNHEGDTHPVQHQPQQQQYMVGVAAGGGAQEAAFENGANPNVAVGVKHE